MERVNRVTHFFALPFQLDFTTNEILLSITAIMIISICVRLIISRNLIESIIFMSAFSLFISVCYLFMDAPDVAMTETALGACLSTCVILNLVKIVGQDIGKTQKINIILATLLCVVLVVSLSWASLDLPEFGLQDSALHSHLTNYYVENTKKDIGVPSMVAAILASYRGYDTLGETTVILIAGLAVLVIVSRRKRSDASKF